MLENTDNPKILIEKYITNYVEQIAICLYCQANFNKYLTRKLTLHIEAINITR